MGRGLGPRYGAVRACRVEGCDREHRARGRCDRTIGEGAVYPRACGGTQVMSTQAPKLIGGLSPRVRGNRHESFNGFALRPCRAYPRTCGGNPQCGREHAAKGFSDPHYVRGNDANGYFPGSTDPGPIPGACGLISLLFPTRGNRVYPRACGGTHFHYSDPLGNGSVPARAGKLSRCLYPKTSAMVHPGKVYPPRARKPRRL